MEGIVSWLPRETALSLANLIGKTAFLVARRERKKTIQHLTLAYGEEKSEKEIRDLAERVFIHFAEVAVDVLRLRKLTRQELEELIDPGEGLSIFKEVLAQGRGAILLTAHFGNWELMGAFVMFSGYPGAVVARKIYYEKFNEVLLDLRERATLRTIYQDAPPKEFLNVLRQNQILGILADQDVERLDGIFVPFFGRPAYTLTAPVKMALATGAPLVPAFLVKNGNRYRFLVEKPIYVEMKGSREETIRDYTVRWSRIVEEKIKMYPDQWAWMHPRWKTAPDEKDRIPKPVTVGEVQS